MLGLSVNGVIAAAGADAIIGAVAALIGAAIGGYATYKVSGPYWERAKLSAVQPLVEARLPRYDDLWELTNYGPKEAPNQLDPAQRRTLADKLRAWYYGGGAGLLLSDAARRQWSAVVDQLSKEDTPPEEIRLAMSCLRTRLKQDVHVHDPNIDDTECRNQPGWVVEPLDSARR